MTTKQDTLVESAPNEELTAFAEQIIAVKDRPVSERVATWTRLTAKFLHKRGALPDHMKKHLDN